MILLETNLEILIVQKILEPPGNTTLWVFMWSSICRVDRLDWDLGLLRLTFQISYFFLLLLVFLIYKTDIVTSLVNYIEICMENCDRTPSISIIVLDIAIRIRRVKTVLCRSDIRILWFFFFLCNNTNCFLLFSGFQADNVEIPLLISFWCNIIHLLQMILYCICHLHLQDVLVCHCDEHKHFTTEENKNIRTWETDDTIFNNCSIHLFWFAANL